MAKLVGQQLNQLLALVILDAVQVYCEFGWLADAKL
jgi:hypothetical protein